MANQIVRVWNDSELKLVSTAIAANTSGIRSFRISAPFALGIMSIPRVIIFKDGQPVERTVGYRPEMKADMKAKLEGLI